MSRAEVRRIRRQQRKLEPEPRPIPLRIREGMLQALDDLSRQNQCDYLVEIHKQLAEAAKDGNIAAAREIYDRLEGRPTQAIDLRKDERESIALQTLRQMPPEVALEQLDGAMRQLQEFRKELLSTERTVNVGAKELPEVTQTDTAGPQSRDLYGTEGVVLLDADVSDVEDALVTGLGGLTD